MHIHFNKKIKRMEKKYIQKGTQINLRQQISKQLIVLIRKLQGFTRQQVQMKYDLGVWQEKWAQGVVILYTNNNQDEARILQEALYVCGVDNIELVQGSQKQYSTSIYFVLCPQYFECLPEIFVAVQTESYDKQTWFNREFLDKLHKAVAVMEVLADNIKILLAQHFAYEELFLFSLDCGQSKYYLARILLAFELINTDKAFEILKAYERIKTIDRSLLALGLPETVARRDAFVNRYLTVPIFDGLRHIRPWIGCALSYKYLAYLALEHNIANLVVCEDDVVLDERFAGKYKLLQEFLYERISEYQWDMFVGLLAEMPNNMKVLDVVEFQGVKFVTIDKMVSTVFNIYGQAAIRRLATWDMSDKNMEKNTIIL